MEITIAKTLLVAVCDTGDWEFYCPNCNKKLAWGRYMFVVINNNEPVAIINDDDISHRCSNNHLYAAPLFVETNEQAHVFRSILLAGADTDAVWDYLTAVDFDQLSPEAAGAVRASIKKWLEKVAQQYASADPEKHKSS